MNFTRKHISINTISFVLIFVLHLVHSVLIAQDLEMVKDLRGQWKFSIGDNPAWLEPDFNDDDWESITVPSAWESEGFYGYDGYAWYRKTINIQNTEENYTYYLKLGYIDDVDKVYVNGIKVGNTGSFPPDYSTAYKANRTYVLPNHLLKNASSITIAVRVFDEGGEGGILHGNISISVDRNAIRPDLNLQGDWFFKTGNCGNPSEKAVDFQTWDKILVPGSWEDQGYKNYDGISCYAKQFKLDGQFENEKVVLMLGKIDDLDMVYVNGMFVGQSGDFNDAAAKERSKMYNQLRGYYLPDDVLNQNGNNTIIVKVYDWWGVGGIWEGDIGLISQDNYITFWRKRKNTIR